MKIVRELRSFLIIVLAVMAVAVFCVPVLACDHEDQVWNTVKNATCTESGQKYLVCERCGATVGSKVIPSVGHDFVDREILEVPSRDKDGLKIRTCRDCGEEKTVTFACTHEYISTCVVENPTCGVEGTEEDICLICEKTIGTRKIETLPHEATHTVVTKAPTCCEMGMEAVVCDACGKTAGEHTLDQLECSYGDWIYTQYATPFMGGLRYRECSDCGKREEEVYTMNLQEDYLYIPGTGINHRVAPTYFTQSAVNGNDIVYTTHAYAQENEKDPFILGHDYGTLGNLHKTKVGQYIYLNVDGFLETYKVVISEYAVEEPAGVRMIGQTTGTNIWDTFSSSISSKYTSYGSPHTGRDIWEGDNDGKTLHMYTCHKGAPCKAEDGRRGRWIVMAVLVENAYG